MTDVGTRAVVRTIEAGLDDICPARGGCGCPVAFSARIPSRHRRRVVANVYWYGRWNRTENWHWFCYVRSGMPHGRPPEITDDELAMAQYILASTEDAWHTPNLALIELMVAATAQALAAG